ncbi:Hypothetical predicted protein [Octopus vulgaris]|uniref:Uncharacterized protein n=1 Tax=Octopus vulgaris TaxID=6645 RepID=A0AA36AR14_OCTVU|nr:Hypothetical predicted protein [Octopus vulgaris]
MENTTKTRQFECNMVFASHHTAKTVLSEAARKYQNWFACKDTTLASLLEQRNKARQQSLLDPNIRPYFAKLKETQTKQQHNSEMK